MSTGFKEIWFTVPNVNLYKQSIILGRFLNLPDLQFSYIKSTDNNSNYPMRLLGGLNESSFAL